jgi:putative membrane protein
MAWAMASMLRMVVMQVSLLMIATAFWTAVFARYRCSGWQAIVAVLVTGKLFCLLGALLVFSPRPLYAPELVSFADQQLAGLIMLTACPLTYVGVAFAMTLVGLRNLATNRHAAY